MNIAEFHNKLIDKAKEFFQDNKVSTDSEKLINYVMLNYLVESFKLVKGINLLYQQGLVGDAKILLRSLFEVYCLSTYVAENPEDITRAEDCMIRCFIAEKKQVKDMEDLGFFEKIKESSDNIEDKNIIKITNYEESIVKLKKREEYCNLTDKEIESRFESKMKISSLCQFLNKKYTNEESEDHNLIKRYYAAVVRDLNAYVHCYDFRGHVNKNEKGGYELFLKDELSHLDIILSTSANLFIEIMSNANKGMSFNKGSLIQELDYEYNKVIGA